LSEAVNIVEGREAESGTYAPVNVGFVLHVGGQLQTGQDSRARLDLSDGAILRLAANSAFTLQDVQPEPEADDLVTRLQLQAGKLWVSLTGGTLEVETPVGVASVRGSYAVFVYAPGDPNDPDDDLLLIDCLEGICSGQNDLVDETFGNLTRLVLTPGGGLFSPLSLQDVLDFEANNQNSGLAATLTALPPATATRTRTPTLPPTASPTRTLPPPPSATFTAIPTDTFEPFTPPPAFRVLGLHTVLPGQTLFCIGRGYGVLPNAIGQASGLRPPFTIFIGQVLSIPDIQWGAIPPGPVCAPQFASPFPGLPTGTPTWTHTPPATATPTCPAGQFFDPIMNRCNPIPQPATSTNTPVGMPTITPVPIDLTGPAAGNLSGTLDYQLCEVTFSAELSDPSGLRSAAAEWTVYDSRNAISSGPTVSGMAGPSGGGTWSFVTPSFTVYVPPFGYISWNVRATDGLSNQSLTAGALISETTGFGFCG
jgi:hypothetical protein